MADERWYRQAFDIIWEKSLERLWLFLLPIVIAWLAQNLKKMPTAVAYPAQYWFGLFALVLGSYVVLLSLAKIIVWLTPKACRWWSPPSLLITAHGGKRAAIEIQHSGEPIMWEARTRILEFSGNVPNSNPLLHQSHLEMDGNLARSLRLAENQSAAIILAKLYDSHYAFIENADDERPTRMESDTADIELSLSTKPRIERFSLKRCFRIRHKYDHLECVEIPCQ